jgi:hypothetical protein
MRRPAAEELSILAENLGLAEIVALTWARDEEGRRRSYELLASVFGLKHNAV